MIERKIDTVSAGHGGASDKREGLAWQTVLIVEGDPSMHKIVSTIFEDAGYRQLQTANGETALSVLQGEQDRRRLDLPGLELRGANLSKADLTEAGRRKDDLTEADLSQADLSRTNLAEANLRGADLAGADLCGANLKRAKMTSAQLAQAVSLKGATMPDGATHMMARITQQRCCVAARASRMWSDLIQNPVFKGLRGELAMHNDGGAEPVIRFRAKGKNGK